jgi:hypothetical protein
MVKERFDETRSVPDLPYSDRPKLARLEGTLQTILQAFVDSPKSSKRTFFFCVTAIS